MFYLAQVKVNDEIVQELAMASDDYDKCVEEAQLYVSFLGTGVGEVLDNQNRVIFSTGEKE